jgi:uncharacterized protein YbjQ (UPF0145 family)
MGGDILSIQLILSEFPLGCGSATLRYPWLLPLLTEAILPAVERITREENGAMKALRQVGSLAFVMGLFIMIFAGMPWYVTAVEDPVMPLWFRAAVFSLLGGILTVLVTVALEQRGAQPALPPDPGSTGDVPLSNTEAVPGRTIDQNLGLVQGHTVYAIWLGKDLSALIRLVLGGELTEYTDMMGKARALATNRMIAEATTRGADAVINIRYMTTSVVGSAAELLVYGTAVKLGP